jgi:hypothetical protein
MNALLLLLSSLVSPAEAAPGRFTVGGTVGAAPGIAVDGSDTLHWRPALRATADYGLTRRLSLTAEVGTVPGVRGIAGAFGPQLEVVDSRWWRLGLVLLPELQVPFQETETLADNLDLRTWIPDGPRVVAHTGARASWLAFWGVSVTARLDYVQPFTAGVGGTEAGLELGWMELGTGLSFRM